MNLHRLAGIVLAASCLCPALLSGAGMQKINPPAILKRVEPVYPTNAQQARIQGVVTVEATIGTDGKVRAAEVLKSIPLLDAAALTAVRQWEYEPTLLNGVAVPVVMTVQVSFTLTDPKAPPSAAPPSAATSSPATPSSATSQGQTEWDALSRNVLQLSLDGKHAEAIATVERFVSRNLQHADAQFIRGRLYEQRALDPGAAVGSKRRDLEAAAKHYATAAALQKDPDLRFVTVWKLVKLHAPDELNDAAAAERYARQLVTQFPARAESHLVYAQLLREKGDISGAADVMRKGRDASTMPVSGLLMAMQYSMEQVQAERDLSRDAVRALIDEGIAAAEEMLRSRDLDATDFRLATMGKGMGLELQAERLADTRAERLRLLQESDRWSGPVTGFKNGTPPPVRKLSAADAADMEWRAIMRWNNRLASDGKLTEAIAGFTKYLEIRPGFHEVHAEMAEVLLRAGETAADPSSKASRLEQAATQLQHLVDLAPSGYERDAAFQRLLALYGPAALNRPGAQEAAARAMVQRHPMLPLGHYALATLLFGSGRQADAEGVLQSARAAIKPSAVSRAGMASELQSIVRGDEVPDVIARRLFDEAGALLGEAEKLNPNVREVVETRMGWLNLSADRFEKDPARAAAQREEALRLRKRAQQLSDGKKLP